MLKLGEILLLCSSLDKLTLVLLIYLIYRCISQNIEQMTEKLGSNCLVVVSKEDVCWEIVVIVID